MSKDTQGKIQKAFLDLLNEKPLSKITVRDIVERCGINRNSFYYHYQDIPSLVEEIVMENANRIMAKYPTIDSIETAMLAALEFIEEHRRAVMHIYQSSSRDIFELHLWRVCDYVVSNYCASLFAGKAVSEEDREIIVEIYKCECFGIAASWINKGMKGNIRPKIHRFCELRRGTAEEMVRRSLET